MATIDAFRLSGVNLWFWSHDHEPPHFHAKRRGEWEIKVHFLLEPADMIEIEWTNKRQSRKAFKELTLLAEQHRVELLAQWEEIHPN